MADEEKKLPTDEDEIDAALDDEQADEPVKKKGPSPIILAVGGLVIFVLFLGVFSYTMGVFNKEETAEQAAEDAASPTGEHQAGDEQAEQSSDNDPADDDGVEFNFGQSEQDTLAEVSWIESEKKKIQADQLALAVERKQLEALRREVEVKLARRKQIEGERVAYLAKLFDGMKQEEVSKVMAELKDETIVAVLPRMKNASASKVLAMLPPKRAARLTTILLGLDE